MANAKATGQPVGEVKARTYRVEGSALTRGYAVIQGTADDQCKLAGADAAALGIVAESVTTVGRPVNIVQEGETIAIAGDVVAAGQWVKVGTGGKLVPSAGEDKHNIGRARTSAAADTDEFVLDVLEVKKRSA
jgi:hypothetical protein